MSKQGARPGDLYTDDAYYRPIEERLEQKYNLPDNLLRDIRVKGERSNKGQVSGAAARSVYQIIPGTRARFQQAYGVDAYAGDAQAAEVAALHLRDSLKRNNGDVSKAVREYVGGTDPKNWGKVTNDYVARVTGYRVPGQVNQRGTTTGRSLSAQEVLDMAQAFRDNPSLSIDDIYSRAPVMPKPLTPEDVAPKPTGASILAQGLLEDRKPEDMAPTGLGDALISQRDVANQVAAEEAAAPLIGDRIMAAVKENWVLSQISRGLDDKLAQGYDPEWAKYRTEHMAEYEAMAENEDELELLRDPRVFNSEQDQLNVYTKIFKDRNRRKTIGGGVSGLALNVGAALLDPVALVATGGVGKVVQVGRAAVGAQAASRAGLAISAAEGAAVNAAFTGAIDFSGENQTVGDYLASAAIGAGIGASLHAVGSFLSRDKLDTSDLETLNRIETSVNEDTSFLRGKAIEQLGEDATEEAIQEHMSRALNDRARRIIDIQLGEIPDADRLLPEGIENSILPITGFNENSKANAKVRRELQRQAREEGIDSITNPAEQYEMLELNARSKAIIEAAGMSDEELSRNVLEKWVAATGLESDAVKLLRSKSPVMKAAGIQLLESTTGLGGRKPSAAVTKFLLENKYSEYLMGYDRAFQIWAKGERKGWTDVNLRNTARKEFDRDVFFEIEARQSDDYIPHSNRAVVEAADALEAGYQIMADHMRKVGVLGSENLPLSARGYITHEMNVGEILNLTDKQRRAVEKVYANQLVSRNSYSYIDSETGEKITKAFDRKFSNQLAKRILDEARGRARGNAYLPANLQTPQGSEIVRQAIKAMGLDRNESEAAMKAFSRGGQSYTKGRLKLDMTADIGDGKKLGDLFNQDIQSLYRNYVRKSSGDVALARYGVLGEKTLQTMRNLGDLTGATRAELEAFERITAEFTNKPWSKGFQAQWIKNTGALTSAAQLGGMVFTQMGEQANAIAALGVRRTLTGIPRMGRIWKNLGQWRKGNVIKDPVMADLDEIFGYVGGSEYHAVRPFDAPDMNVEVFGQESLSFFSKFARGSSYLTRVASGFRAFHAVQTRGMSENVIRKALVYIKRGEADAALKDMGITDDMVKAMKAEMDAGRLVKIDDKGRIVGPVDFIGSQLDPAMIHNFFQTVERGSSQIIQKTFIGETSKWAHNDLLKLLAQFRTFGITSMEKQQGRQWRIGGGGFGGASRLFMINLAAMSFALPIHLTRLQVQSLGMSRQERKEFFEKRANVAALASAVSKYVSALGLAPDAADVVLGLGSGWGVLPEGMSAGRGTGFQSGPSGLIPSLGMADNALKGISGSPSRLIKILPGQNLPFVTPFWNGIEAAVSDNDEL